MIKMNFFFALLGIILIALILFLVYMSIKLIQGEQIFHRDTLARLATQKLLIKGILKQSTMVKEDEKKLDEWRNFNYTTSDISDISRDKHTRKIPYLFIDKTKFANTNAIVEDNIFSDASYLLICHGAAYETEFCYKEYEEIANRYNISIICVEYPGFGERSEEILTEDALMKEYPKEVISLIEDHLQIKWNKITLLGQCLGAPIAINISSATRGAKKLKSLILTKPWPSLHTCLQSLTGISEFSLNILLPNLFKSYNLEKSNIYCPVKCVQGDADKICQVEDTIKTLEEMDHSPIVEFYLVPEGGHTIYMSKMLDHISNYVPNEILYGANAVRKIP